jgi:uncharacterized membrane protein
LLSKAVLNAIALVTTFVWAANFVASVIPALNYKTDPQIHLIFGSLVGAAFALPKLLGGKGKEEDPPPGKHAKAEDVDT